MRLFRKIADLAVFLLLPLTVSATTFAAGQPYIRYYKSSKGPHRTITWQAWKEVTGGAFRWRTGDRFVTIFGHILAPTSKSSPNVMRR
jgi:hypothetical protein